MGNMGQSWMGILILSFGINVFFFCSRVSKVGHVKYMDHLGFRLHPGCAQPMIVLHFPHGKCTRGILKQIQEGGWFLGYFSGKLQGLKMIEVADGGVAMDGESTNT